MAISFLKTAALLLIFVIVGSANLASIAIAQQKYSTEHPDVEKMVRKGVGYLRANPEISLGELVLSALAIVQAGKRYEQEVPIADPIIEKAVGRILESLPRDGQELSDDKNLLRMNEVYVPCLAMILLAEVNDLKHKATINRLLESLQARQEKSGAFNYLVDPPNVGDTSQTQYVALALFVAKQHGFAVSADSAKGALQWLIDSQQANGSFFYKLKQSGNAWVPEGNSRDTRLSIHAAGLGTAYLLSDLLQLSDRKKNMTQMVAKEGLVGLPGTVSPYVKPLTEGALLNKTGPLVDFNVGRLNANFASANRLYESNFSIDLKEWTFYYLYALERYAWFREQTEGSLGGGKISQWYDSGVEYLKKNQQNDGKFFNTSYSVETPTVCTAFAVLFLVRSSEVITTASSGSELTGGIGFPTGQTIRSQGGDIIGSEAEQNLASMIDMLEQEPTSEQLEALTKSLKNAVVEFKNQDVKSRGEIKSFLRTMISAREYFRRKIAVRFLAGEQDMDNVPALIFALGDPDFRVCIEAHDGLRLISRKIDSLSVTDETRRNSIRDPGALTATEASSARSEFDSLKKQWTEWFLKIRPSAEMLD